MCARARSKLEERQIYSLLWGRPLLSMPPISPSPCEAVHVHRAQPVPVSPAVGRPKRGLYTKRQKSYASKSRQSGQTGEERVKQGLSGRLHLVFLAAEVKIRISKPMSQR
jgi:hypothetical protein